jgi:primosomal protein N' (replication factor Y)
MNYPPFSKILNINLSSENEHLLIKNIQNVGIILKNQIDNNDKIEMLGPCPCSISKIKSQYRWQILFKGDISYKEANDIRLTIYKLLKDVYNDIRISIDFNPSSLL